jgi:hypothetical protein
MALDFYLTEEQNVTRRALSLKTTTPKKNVPYLVASCMEGRMRVVGSERH